MNGIKEQKKAIINPLLFGISLFLFGYTALRAYLLSFTSDESYTYIEYVSKNFTTFSHYGNFDANNHLLNTWLMELSSKLFGVTEFSLRLPNVLSHLVFLFYTAKLVRNLSSTVLIIGSFLIININPFLLDFFSLARGYGISMALMMGSIFYACNYISSKKSYLSAFFSVLFASLGLLSYFLLLNYLLIISFLFIIVYFIRNRRLEGIDKSREVLIHIRKILIILSPLSILFFAIPIMFHLMEAKAFDFGYQHGFWNDTVCSLIANNLYENNAISNAMAGIQIGVVVVLITSILTVIMLLMKKENRAKNSFFLFIFIVLFLCLIANYIQHKWMGILFNSGRYALYYFLLFIVLMIQLFAALLKTRLTKLIQGIFIITALLFVVNFINAANLHYTNNWKKESDTKDLFQYLQTLTNEGHLDKGYINIGVPSLVWLFDYDFKFYSAINNKVKFHIMSDENFNNPAVDYLFVDKEILNELHDPAFKILKEYPCSEMVLISDNRH